MGISMGFYDETDRFHEASKWTLARRDCKSSALQALHTPVLCRKVVGADSSCFRVCLEIQAHTKSDLFKGPRIRNANRKACCASNQYIVRKLEDLDGNLNQSAAVSRFLTPEFSWTPQQSKATAIRVIRGTVLS